ncbi:phosphatase PAP2 family protein [Dyadobacter sp. 3J3]|uniref:phosphatase PAP2 family protein n=1 Tax=Dyadobacter sp. 3J3 TaxID=2606600 RepID=UPI001359B00E|nr:phosphatase PAP2 family protein [Dyadobacter sp. 3J3]
MKKQFTRCIFFVTFICQGLFSSNISAQAIDSVYHDSLVQKKEEKLWQFRPIEAVAPVSLALAAFVTQGSISRHLKNNLVGQTENLHTHADDYLRYLPGAVSLSLGASGVKGKHSFGDQLVLAILSNIIAQGVTGSLKMISKYPRPDGSDNKSFPSGHASSAFTNATILHEEYGQRSVWYSVGGYTTATAVGGMRVLQNKHWLADVLMGAGIGIAATKVVYISYPWLKQTVRRIRKR